MKFDENNLYQIQTSIKGERYSLFDLATWKNGLAFRKINFSDTGVPVIKIAELNNGIRENTSYTNQVFSDDVHIKEGDLLFSWSGNPQTSIDIYRFQLNEGWLNQHIFKVIPNEQIVDKDYLFYLMKYLRPHFTQIASNKQTTGLGHITIADLKRINIILPALSYQRKVVNVLKPIDDEIELNNTVNQNLEQQLQAVFKVWFVEKNAHKGIETFPLSELCSIVTKGTTPTTLGHSFTDKGVNYIKAESILDNHTIDKNRFVYIDSETNVLLKRSIICSGDILFTIAGTLGRFALVDENVLPANTNQAVAIIRADREKVTPQYLYSFFIGGWHDNYYSKRVQQAVQANLSLTTIKSLPIPLLQGEEMEEYLNIITPIISMIKANEHECETLSILRDTLLPKLMSGKLDVSSLDV